MTATLSYLPYEEQSCPHFKVNQHWLMLLHFWRGVKRHHDDCICFLWLLQWVTTDLVAENNRNLFSPVLGHQTPSISVSAELHRRLRGEWILAPSSFWRSWTFLGLWLHDSTISASLCTWPPSSLHIVPSLSLTRTLVIVFRAHTDNPKWSHLEIRNHTCKVRLSKYSHRGKGKISFPSTLLNSQSPESWTRQIHKRKAYIFV